MSDTARPRHPYPVPGLEPGTHVCVPSMIDSLEVQVHYQPDGGEGLAKRKSLALRRH
jgi:hypothetical protein